MVQGFRLIGCILDGDALRNGTVSLWYVPPSRRIFPTPFHMPDRARGGPSIADMFPPTRTYRFF